MKLFKYVSAGLLSLSLLSPTLASANAGNWITTWGTSSTETGPSFLNFVADGYLPKVFNNQTIRMITHTSVKGTKIRIRLSNAHPTPVVASANNESVTISEAHIAIRSSGAAIYPQTDKVLTFGGQHSVVIPPNGDVLSDPISLRVPAQSDLAISMHVVQDSSGTGPMYAARHPVAKQTSYIAGTQGNFTGNTDGSPYTETTTQWFYVSGVEVLDESNVTTIAAFGDSLTDGFSFDPTALDSNSRYPDFLASRLQDDGNPMGMLNAGISGNQILFDVPFVDFFNMILAPYGQSGVSRFSQDVLSRPGVSHVIIWLGHNDIFYSYHNIPSLPNNPSPATSAQITAGLEQLITLARQQGLKVYGATLSPIAGSGSLTDEGEAVRQSVNQWIRTSGAFDAVLDFEQVVVDPSDPSRINPLYDSGDQAHLNAIGYKAIADSIDLQLFQQQ